MKILTVVAHPDDEVLGCGGTIARLVEEGHQAYTLILGKGITARNNWSKKDLMKIEEQAREANHVLGVKDVFIHDFPDNSFDIVTLLKIIKVIERIKDRIKPDVVFTHSQNDLNIDHRITNQAVITVTRPMEDETVKQVYGCEILSSTEWNFPLKFSPNLFYDITKTITKKTSALRSYKGEIRNDYHPRSVEGIGVQARQRGMIIGVKYAEAFEVIRDVRK